MSPRTIGLVAVLTAATATGAYLQGAFAVLSAFMIEELSITRSQLGLAIAVFNVSGALGSPVMGGLTDRGPRKVMVALFGLSAAGMLLSAAAPSYALLLPGAAIGGLALGAANPVTNRIIVERVPLPRRGLVTGLKQAGPPLGLLAAGLLLPPIAVALDWRAALVASALVPLMGLAATPRVMAGGPSSRGSAETPRGDLPPRWVVGWMTVMGFGVATGLSAVIAFLPLYAQERVGLSPTTAGMVAAFMGLVGVAARVLWGTFSGRFGRLSTALLIQSVAAVATAAALMAAQAAGPAFLWIGAFGAGATMQGWHTVAWLVIMERVGTAALGKASGVIQLGNSMGFAAGPAGAGLLLDATGSYPLAYALVGLLFGVITGLTLWVRAGAERRRRSSAGG